MKEKGILKFKGTNTKGAMHFINYKGTTVSLTNQDSRKVSHIKDNGTLLIAQNLLSRNFEEKKVKVNEDQATIKSVFEFMKDQKHTHFKNSYKNLVVLEYV